MLAMEVPLNGGIGYVVLFGGFEMTGVLVLSVALQPAKKIESTIKPSALLCALCVTFAPLREMTVLHAKLAKDHKDRKEVILVLLIEFIFGCGSFTTFLWQWFTGDTILTLDPATEVDHLAPF